MGVLDLVQEMLLEPATRNLFYFGSGVTRRWPDGEIAVGGEIFENETWREMAREIPGDGLGLFLIVSGDTVVASNQTQHPVYISIANLPVAYRDPRLFALLPVPYVRRPHGKKGERLDADQKRGKAQLKNDALAIALAPLEIPAQIGVPVQNFI